MKKQITHVVSFSGGRSSAYLVYLMEIARKKYGWNVKYIFCDTGVEHPQTYVFIRNIVKFWNIDLTILRAIVNPTLGQGNTYQEYSVNDLMNSAVMPPFEPFLSMMIKYGTPNAVGPYCSERMKKDVFDAYCKANYGKSNYLTWLGIRSDEPKRLKPKPGIKYLGDLVTADRDDIIHWWKTQPFDLELEEQSGNCLMCIKKSSAKIALAIKQNPNFYHMWKYHLANKNIRVKDGYDPMIMYRGSLSLDGIAKMYDSMTEDELRSRMRSSKRFETGHCAESCEAFIEHGNEINFDVVNQEIYKEFERELQLNQFELELV